MLRFSEVDLSASGFGSAADICGDGNGFQRVLK
jgi:hypothetical protein